MNDCNKKLRRLKARALNARKRRQLQKNSNQAAIDKYVDNLVNKTGFEEDICQLSDDSDHERPANDGPSPNTETPTDHEFPVDCDSALLVTNISETYQNELFVNNESDNINVTSNVIESQLSGGVYHLQEETVPNEQFCTNATESFQFNNSSDDGTITDIEDNDKDFNQLALPKSDTSGTDRYSFSEDEVNPDEQLQGDLAKWAVKYNIRSNAVSHLNVLRDHGHPSLPKCAKTLLRSPRTTVNVIRELEGGGQYWYFGIKSSLLNRMGSSYQDNIIDGQVVIDVFTDGLSPYKSARTQIWPIVGRLLNLKTPFLIALWCGETKEPTNVHAFWDDFITEAANLMEGFQLNGNAYKLVIRKYMGDAPARAWFKKVNPHNSKICCERCTVSAFSFERRMVFGPNNFATPRTDQSFLDQDQKIYHRGESPLLRLGTRMISQVPLDTMHLLYLGVMKRMLVRLFVKKQSILTLRKQEIEEQFAVSLSILKYLPSEFKTRRSLKDMKFMKAKEYRRIALYDGFLLFRNLPHYELFYNFLLFACSLRILGSPAFVRTYVDDAEKLLKEFVKNSKDVYGQWFIVYNVHHLEHLAEDCRRHGTLEEISCFPYENYLGQLKHFLYAPGRTLSQIVCRIMEQITVLPNVEPTPKATFTFQQPHFSGPKLGCKGQEFMKMETTDYLFRLASNDSYCLTKTEDVVWIQNFVQSNDRNFFIGQKFESKVNYFEEPLPSAVLGIFKVQGLKPLEKWNVTDIKTKVVLFPLKAKDDVDWTTDVGLCLPMLHNANYKKRTARRVSWC